MHFAPLHLLVKVHKNYPFCWKDIQYFHDERNKLIWKAGFNFTLKSSDISISLFIWAIFQWKFCMHVSSESYDSSLVFLNVISGIIFDFTILRWILNTFFIPYVYTRWILRYNAYNGAFEDLNLGLKKKTVDHSKIERIQMVHVKFNSSESITMFTRNFLCF